MNSGYESDNSIERVAVIDLMIEKEIREKARSLPSRSHEDDRATEMYIDFDLYLAAINGDLDDFKRVLNRVSTNDLAACASVDILSRLSLNGNTFLHVAANHGNEGIVNFIASMKPSFVLAKNFDGETALHLVAKSGDESMVKALVQIHRDLLASSQNAEGENNLLMAENERGNTALYEALFSGRNSIAEYLIREHPLLAYHQNNKKQSALYLAAKNSFVDCISLILRLCVDEERLNELFKKKSPIAAAIKRKHRDVLEAIFNTQPRLIQIQDGEGRTPLHFAASLGDIETTRYLLQKCALNGTRRDKAGTLPIHLAAVKGHVDIISLLLQDFPDTGELLDTNGSNILHIAAKSGRYNVLSFIYKNPHLDYLINMKDKSGNTPLHWASRYYHPKIVSNLTWNKRVDIKVVNNKGETALDVAENHMSYNPQFRQRLTWVALKAAAVPRHVTKSKKASGRSKSFNMDNYKERVNTLLLVATLVATITFAAGFTMPGGYISSESSTDLGMATMLRDKGFHVFVLCDAIAMYSSILVATALMWAQLGDLNLVLNALTLAVPLLGIALSMMSIAFTAGIIIVVTRLRWLRTAVLAMSISFLAILFLLLLPLCTPFASRSRVLRYLSYYPYCLLIFVTC